MGGGGSEVWIAEASENSKRGVVWEGFVKKLIGYIVLYGGGGSPIEEESGSGKGLSPVGRWHGRMKEHGADSVILWCEACVQPCHSVERYRDTRGGA